jgi:hypothetical protein
MRAILALAVVGLTAATAMATIQINEVVGSTPSTDWEFIELKNTGAAPVDIGDWSIELWDSDDGASYGGADDGSPFVIPTGTILAPGAYFTMGNLLGQSGWSYTADVTLADNSIENGSYTMILVDATSAVVESLFVWDSGAADSANRAGAPIVPDATVGPDGTFLPAGGYRVSDGATWEMEEFAIPGTTATPGAMNIPEPASLALLAIAGAFALRRRR